jgi:hypothetical protein
VVLTEQPASLRKLLLVTGIKRTRKIAVQVATMASRKMTAVPEAAALSKVSVGTMLVVVSLVELLQMRMVM